MSKRNILVFTLISSVISLVLVILSYCGHLRYLMIRMKPLQGYIDNYKNLPKIGGKKHRVVISFTTTPQRINIIKPMLKSILDQTFRVDQIALNVPYNHKGVKYNIPDQYLEFLNVYKTGRDYGPCTCIIPTLTREGEKDTIIIIVRDDKMYGHDFVETMFVESQTNPNDALYTDNQFSLCGSVLIKPDFFDESVIDYSKKKISSKWIEDRLLCKKRKVNYNRIFNCK